MYILDFDAKDKESCRFFELLYEAWVIGSHLDQRGGNWKWMLEVEGEITKSFQMIARPMSCGRKLVTDDQALTLVDGLTITSINLTKEQFELLARRFQIVPWNVARIPIIENYFKRLMSTTVMNDAPGKAK